MESLRDVMLPVLQRCFGENLPEAICTVASRGDSPLEERFWGLIDQTIGGRNESLDQFEIGRHRVDSIFVVPRGAVVIELDGAAFHRDPAADHFRDKDLLRQVDCVIRIPYSVLMTHPRSMLHTLGMWYERFKLKGIPLFKKHDDPYTANLSGLERRTGYGNHNPQITERILRGQRKR